MAQYHEHGIPEFIVDHTKGLTEDGTGCKPVSESLFN
jgi:hypothetical protein